MGGKKVMLWAVLSVLLGLCILSGTVLIIRNRPYLTDPPQDSLDLTIQRDIRSEADITDLAALITFAREVVDEWFPDAYLYSVRLVTPCGDLTDLQTVHFNFLKVNHLDLYTKQWYAFVYLDLEEGKVRLRVEKEEDDPPPPLQTPLDLSGLVVNLREVLELAGQVEIVENECVRASITLYENRWNISYVDEQLGPNERYPYIKIDALTGEVE